MPLIWNNSEKDFYRTHHIRRAQCGHIARPFGKLAHAHSARRLDGGIVLLRHIAVTRSASFDDIEFDGHGQFLSIACLQESQIDLRARAILQAGDGYSVFSFEGRAHSYEKRPNWQHVLTGVKKVRTRLVSAPLRHCVAPPPNTT